MAEARQIVTQQPLFPVNVKSLVPNTTGSVDLRHFAIGDDGHTYAAKESIPGNPTLPAAEYLSYCLCASCQIAVPVTAKLVMPDGSVALGSRFEGGVDACSILQPADQIAALSACAAPLTALLTLDVFLANDDRHGGNFMHRKAPITNQWTMVAIDFSRALWAGGFPTQAPAATAASGNTATTIAVMKQFGFWDKARSHQTILALGAVTPSAYASWVGSLPSAWQTPAVVASPAWWATQARTQRMQETLNCL